MKRFSRKWFAQIMIHKQLKQELDELEKVFTIKYKINYKLSYADVIRILIREYKKPFRVVYPLSQKTLVGTKINRENLKVAMPLRKSASVWVKLDGKPKVAFSLKS